MIHYCLFILYFEGIAKDIIDLAVHGKAQNESYNRLAKFTDKFGSRLAGSNSLENAIGIYNYFLHIKGTLENLLSNLLALFEKHLTFVVLG